MALWAKMLQEKVAMMGAEVGARRRNAKVGADGHSK